jgi:hypothetical protein
MNTLIIICKLNSTPSSYVELARYLKTAPKWACLFDGAWIIRTTSDAAYIRDGVKSRILPSDKVLVVSTNLEKWGSFNLSKDVTDWIKSLE